MEGLVTREEEEERRVPRNVVHMPSDVLFQYGNGFGYEFQRDARLNVPDASRGLPRFYSFDEFFQLFIGDQGIQIVLYVPGTDFSGRQRDFRVRGYPRGKGRVRRVGFQIGEFRSARFGRFHRNVERVDDVKASRRDRFRNFPVVRFERGRDEFSNDRFDFVERTVGFVGNAYEVRQVRVVADSPFGFLGIVSVPVSAFHDFGFGYQHRVGDFGARIFRMDRFYALIRFFSIKAPRWGAFVSRGFNYSGEFEVKRRADGDRAFGAEFSADFLVEGDGDIFAVVLNDFDPDMHRSSFAPSMNEGEVFRNSKPWNRIERFQGFFGKT